MKIKVEVTRDVYQENAKKGDIGYIAGYTNWGTNNIPVCIVVFKDFISLISYTSLKPINEDIPNENIKAQKYDKVTEGYDSKDCKEKIEKHEELLNELKKSILANYGELFKDCYFIKKDFVNKLEKELGWNNN